MYYYIFFFVVNEFIYLVVGDCVNILLYVFEKGGIIDVFN